MTAQSMAKWAWINNHNNSHVLSPLHWMVSCEVCRSGSPGSVDCPVFSKLVSLLQIQENLQLSNGSFLKAIEAYVVDLRLWPPG